MAAFKRLTKGWVSMKSGLEGRNNENPENPEKKEDYVSMKSGLEGRNNISEKIGYESRPVCLNEVRPRRPEQFAKIENATSPNIVSMKSGLEGRNNPQACPQTCV